jgi:hypothetical protein
VALCHLSCKNYFSCGSSVVIKTFVFLIFHLVLCVLAVDPGLAQIKHMYATSTLKFLDPMMFYMIRGFQRLQIYNFWMIGTKDMN